MPESNYWTLRVSGIPKSNPENIASELKLLLKKSFPEFENRKIRATNVVIASCKKDSESIALIDLEGNLPATISKTMHTELFGHSVTIDSQFLGLTQLYDTSNDQSITAEYVERLTSRNIAKQSSIIAITGLGGHAYNSWRGRGNPNFMWLRHALGNAMPSCRTMTYGYESQLSAFGISRILEYGRAFLSEVDKVRRTTVEMRRPLFIIGHSYGGLVLARSIIESYMRRVNQTETASTTLHQASYGFVFFAVPHRGMIVDDMIETIGESHPRNALLKQITQNPEQTPDSLENQLDHFRELLQHRKVITVYEQLQSQRLERQEEGEALKRTGRRMTLMSPESAIIGLINQSEKKIPSMRDHSDVAKFDSAQDTVLETIIDALQTFNKEAPTIVSRQFYPHEQTWRHQHQQRYGNVVRWLSPQDHENDHYKEDLEDARSLRHPGTCRWILARSEYETWSNSRFTSECSLLWICAIPGAGKTVLASYLIDQAVQKSSDIPQNISYFFFKGTDKDKDNPLAAAKALIYQLLQSDIQMELLDDLQHCMETSSHPRAFNFKSLWGLFCKYCSRLPKHYILLDALDECENVKLLLPGLFELSQRHSIKVIFTGREQDLISELNGLPMIKISPEDVADDIENYINYQVSERPTLSDRRVRPRIIRILNARSKGMFLWVALMIKELESLSSIDEIDEALSSIPEDLPGVYERILKRLHSKLKPSKRLLCIRLLRWIVLAKRPLHLEELKDALRLDYAITPDGFCFVQNLLCSQRELESICGSLVTSKNQTIQLIHFSTKEFLLSPIHSPSLDGPLQEFLVSVLEDGAYMADRLLFFVADFWKSAGVLVQLHGGNEDDEIQMPFLEYACLNWVSHIIESRPQNIRRYAESMKDFFYSYQSWWSWIDYCLTVQPNCLSQLRINVQNLLNWSNAYAEDDLTSLRPEPFESILNQWAESILLILEDYGLALQDTPQRVHGIDPTVVQVPAVRQPMASRCESMAYERHVIFGSRQASLPPLRLAVNRQLPRNTSRSDEYGFFHFDRRRNAFFFVDKYPSSSNHKLECQEARTGRRALPVIDSELQDDTWVNAEVAGAAMSPDSRYLGLVYKGVFIKTSGVAPQTTFYTVVWLLQNIVNFSGESSTPWARKVISLTAKTDSYSKSACLINFTAKNILCCPSGYVDLITGDDESLPGQSSLELQKWSIHDFTFSSRSQDLFFMTGGLEMAVTRISRKGDIHEVAHIEHTFSPKLVGVSQSGRFLIWRQACDQFSYDFKYCIHDTFNNKTSDIEAPLSRRPHDPKIDKFVFTKDDKELLGIIHPIATESEMADTHMIFWSLENATCDIRGTRILKGEILGCCIDDVEKMVYIVNQKRIWNCYNLRTRNLCNLHADSEGIPLHRIEHKVSRDGERLALLHIEPNRVSIQVFELSHTDNALIDRTLDLPERNYENALAVFSPNLELLFIGNIIMSTGVTDTRPLPVPTHFLHQNTMNGLDWENGWNGSFSACSEYLVLFLDTMDHRKQSAKLFLLHIGVLGDSIDELTFPDLDIAPHERLDVSFHPYRTHILLLSGQKAIPRYEVETTCRLLDLKTGGVEGLGSQSHPRRCVNHAFFSTCGTYAVKLHDLVELFWPIPMLHSLREPKPLPTASSLSDALNAKASDSGPFPSFNMITTDGIFYWTSFQFRLLVQRTDLVLNLRCLSSGQVQQESLTIIPKRLERARTIAVVGDDWSSQNVRLVFVSDGVSSGGRRIAEMKELNFTLQSFLYRFRSWRFREEWGEGLKARILSDSTLCI